ncbi:MAG: hypothetical protein HOP28_08490 [Gemmatimonadales bacterium]|nr:hypothetical protein [Gemmatimonadales bacterium]
MTTRKKTERSTGPSPVDQARDELFSHILRCGVTEAEPEHQKEWMDDTMQYLAERYTDLGEEELAAVRVLGERFCKPVVRGKPEVAGSQAS